MENKFNNGYIYSFQVENSEENKTSFTQIIQLNSNFEQISTLKITPTKLISISSKHELLQWDQDEQNNLKLTEKPTYLYQNIKFKSISLSKSVTIGLDINGRVFVWGQSSEGVLGLGFDISKAENPTILEDLKNIIQISHSDHHAVAINSEGMAYSWGTGKYGELGLERSIYSSIPQQILTDSCYSKVFCSNLITCFLDFEGHFHYFGVVIKQLSGNGSTLTIKSLLEEKIYHDGKMLFLEKQIEELENESFKIILIGNGFIVLLSYSENIFILEYNDKLTKLYSKYNLNNISLIKNDIYGFAKEEKNNINYHYLLRWKSNYTSENDLFSDSWSTTIWKFIDDNNTLDNCELFDSNSNKNYLFLKLISQEKEKDNNEEILNMPDDDNMEKSLNIKEEEDKENNNNNENDLFKNITLEFESEFDDSYNLKYKRNQLNSELSVKTSIFNNNNIYNSFYAFGKNSSNALNYNQKANKTVLFQRLNSPLTTNTRNIFDKNGINSGNKNSTLKGNFIYNSNLEFSKIKINNKNELNDNVNLFELDDNNRSINNNKNDKNDKNDKNRKNKNISYDNYNSDENDFAKNELKKYRNEVDNIINNFKQKKQSKSFSMLGKNKKNINNIQIIDKYKGDDTSVDISNNDLIQGYSITKSISNKIQNNENSLSINNDNNKKNKNKKNDELSDDDKEIENNIKSKSRNKDRNSPQAKRKFKDKKLNNIVEHLSLIEEESEPSNDIFKRRRRFSFSKQNKKHNLKNKIENIKKKIYNNKNNIKEEENISSNKSIEDEDDFNFNDLNKKRNSDFNLLDINLINRKKEQKAQKENQREIKNNTNLKKDNNKIINIKNKKDDKNNDLNNEENYNEENEESDNNDNKKEKIRGKNKYRGKSNKDKIIYNENLINNEEELEKYEDKDEDEETNKDINKKNNLKRKKIDNKNINQNRNKNRVQLNNSNNNENINYNEEESDDTNENKIKTDVKSKINKMKKVRKNNQNYNNKNLNKNENNNNNIVDNEDEEFEDDEENENNSLDKNNNKNNIMKNRTKKRINKKRDLKEDNNNSDIEEEIEEEYIDDKGKLVKKRKKIKKSNNNNQNESENEEEQLESSENINNNISDKKIKNAKSKNQSKESKESNIYNNGNNGLSPKKSIKFKYTFGKNVNENNNISSNEKNPFKNDSKRNNISPQKFQKYDSKNSDNNNKEEYEENEEEEFEEQEDQENIDNKNCNKSIIKSKKKGNKIKGKNEKDINNKNNLNKNNEMNLTKLNKKQKKENNVIEINDNTKTVMMYFVYLVNYYMKKKLFALYANKIAEYQKYLEKKFALKILYRVLKKRIIFYKIKFFHRYKKIYKYLYKNNIETITQIYTEESSSYYFFSENNNFSNNNKIIQKNNKIETNNTKLKEKNKINKPKVNTVNGNKNLNNKNNNKKTKNVKSKK